MIKKARKIVHAFELVLITLLGVVVSGVDTRAVKV